MSGKRCVIVRGISGTLCDGSLCTAISREGDVDFWWGRRLRGSVKRFYTCATDVTFRRILLRDARFVKEGVAITRTTRSYHSTVREGVKFLSLSIRMVPTFLGPIFDFEDRFRFRVFVSGAFSSIGDRIAQACLVCVLRNLVLFLATRIKVGG